ncbi:MAG: hypothetical protein IH936_02950 [Acidobacteria bacterium]|nr:hypothetical protein [Acidobacteriota bacterium]
MTLVLGLALCAGPDQHFRARGRGRAGVEAALLVELHEEHEVVVRALGARF